MLLYILVFSYCCALLTLLDTAVHCCRGVSADVTRESASGKRKGLDIERESETEIVPLALLSLGLVSVIYDMSRLNQTTGTLGCLKALE